MKDNNVYLKTDRGRYIPYGVCYQPEHLPDGIWYVRHTDYGKSITSVKYIEGLYKVGDSKSIDLTELCGMEDLCEYITNSKEFKETINSKSGFSSNDIVHLCVKKLVEKARNEKVEK